MASFLFSFNGEVFALRRACQSILPSAASATMLNAASTSFSGATTASTAPSLSACWPLRSLPVVIHSSALSEPITRGRRTVPPKPGIRPSFTSGKPIAAVVSATRKSQASAISQPPPSANPLMAAIVGTGRSSKRSKT